MEGTSIVVQANATASACLITSKNASFQRDNQRIERLQSNNLGSKEKRDHNKKPCSNSELSGTYSKAPRMFTTREREGETTKSRDIARKNQE